VPSFAPVQIAAAVERCEENSRPWSEDDRQIWQLPAARNGLIEIDLGNRRRIRVDAQVDPEALARVLDVLERRMIAIPGNVRVWLATGHTDMRRV
jgi:transposase